VAIKHKACAYCGLKDHPREKGHVFPDNIYPSGLDPRVQYRTVPECTECKKIWQDAEAHFRIIIAIAGDPNAHVQELWDGPISRSFDKSSGPRWVRDVREQLVPVETESGPRHAVYPERDSMVMLVMRKIVRGLCHYHNVETAIADNRVLVQVQRFAIPPAFIGEFKQFSLGDQFCRYAFNDMRADDTEFHSFWVIEFFGRTSFFGMVAKAEAGWPERAA
jgi:hypothetical protein